MKCEYLPRVFGRDPRSQYLGAILTDEAIAKLVESPWSYTILKDGVPLVVGGVAVHWPERGEIWAMVDQTAGSHFVGIHRKVKEYIDALPMRRLETVVEWDFEPGHRWVKMLGFKREADRMRSYGMDGKDYSLYAKVRG